MASATAAVDLDRRIIQVRAGQAKTASRRVIPVTGNLAAWLAPLPRRGKVVASSETAREMTELARSLGIAYPRNVLRHSFISYRIAMVKSADQVALEAGNSPSIIFRHYRELVTEDVANEWFAILQYACQHARRAPNGGVNQGKRRSVAPAIPPYPARGQTPPTGDYAAIRRDLETPLP